MENAILQPLADADDSDLWAALLDETPVRAVDVGPDAHAWPDEADDLEATVRRHGGRLPGSDPRR